MNCDEIIVKNEPVCFDRSTRSSVKRQISQSKTDVSKTSSKRPKLSTKQFYFIYLYLSAIKLL